MHKRIKNKNQGFHSKKFMIIIFFFYLKLNNEETNIDFIVSKVLKVSVFLPIFNKDKFLIRSISSIQSQSLKNIEIVAVNDCSTDKTLKILKKLSKKDCRIKIINNDRNHGLLYSRAMGIKNSRGQYLMNLDPDDRLYANNNLLILYNKAKILNLDYIIFLIKIKPINKTEIEISKIKDKLQLQMEDFLITNKFIKKEILLRAFQYFSNEIYGCKWNYHEDNIWNLLTRKYGKKKNS